MNQHRFEALLATSFQPSLRLHCDVCGRFIALADFGHGAKRRLVTPDSDRSREEYETLCAKHGGAA